MYVFGTVGKVELTAIMDYSSCNRVVGGLDAW